MNRLVKKTGIYFIGNIASRCMTALLIPIYALFVTGDALGSYDYLITLNSILYPVAFGAVWEGVLKYGIGNDPLVPRENVLASAFCIFLPVLAAFIALQIPVCLSLGYSRIESLSLAVMICVTGLASVWQYCVRALGHTRRYIESGIAGSACNFGLVMVLVCALNGQLLGLVTSYCAGQSLIVVYIEAREHILRIAAQGDVDRGLMGRMLRYCIPCVFNLLSLGLLTGVGRIMITNSLGPTANGLYAFAMKFASVITSIGSIFSMAVTEEGILRSDSRIREFYFKLINGLISVLFSVAILSIPTILIFYAFIAATEYAESFVLVPVLVLYAVCMVLSTNFGTVFMAAGRTAVNMWTTMLAVVACMMGSSMLLPLLGVVGVAIGLLLGSVVMVLCRAIASMRLVHFRVLRIRLISLIVLYLVACMGALNVYWNGIATWPTASMLAASIAAVPIALSGLRLILSISDE